MNAPPSQAISMAMAVRQCNPCSPRSKSLSLNILSKYFPCVCLSVRACVRPSPYR